MGPGFKKRLYSLAVPGGVVLVAAVVLLQSGTVPSWLKPFLHFYPYLVYAAGFLLAWRFHCSRIAFAMLVLALADRALLLSSTGRAGIEGAILFSAVAVLLPANFVALSFTRDRGLLNAESGYCLGIIGLQCVLVALFCRAGQPGAGILEHTLAPNNLQTSARLPQLALLAFGLALAVLLARFFLYYSPVESAFFWAVLGAFSGLRFGSSNGLGSVYLGTSGLLLVIALVERSYLMAYHDTLTGLSTRRAFHELIASLREPYSVAMVDVDHFKKFNDLYGHETGDHVLRLVASKLAEISGGGKAFRWGGEEFLLLFPDKHLEEVLLHLEQLRQTIEDFTFTVRSPDRGSRTSQDRGRVRRQRSSQVFVTVSIGVADSGDTQMDVEQVIRMADKVLYSAKAAGRNRVEAANLARRQTSRGTRQKPLVGARS